MKLGLRLKITMMAVVLLVLVAAATGIFSYLQASKIILANGGASMQASAQAYAEKIEYLVNERISEVMLLSNNPVLRDPAASAADKTAILKMYKDIADCYLSISLTDASGLQVADTEGVTGDDKSDFGWFKGAATGKVYYSDVRVSVDMGMATMNFSAPVYDHAGNFIGVVVTRLDLEKTMWAIAGKFGEDEKAAGRPENYAYLINKEGVFIYHPTKEMILRDNLMELGVPELVGAGQEMIAGRSGIVAYHFRGVDKTVAYAPLKGYGKYVGQGWSIGVGVSDKYYLASAKVIRNGAITIGLVLTILGFIFASLLSHKLTVAIKELVEKTQKIAEGDLTQRINVKSKDEIGELAITLNSMAESLRNLVTRIMENAQTVAAHSQELAASGEEVSATIEEVASTTNEVAAIAAKSMENANTAVKESETVGLVAKEGNEKVKHTVAKINAISVSTDEVGKAVKNLGELSMKIGSITNVITGIADQTNLLALNAAIEAARAGDQGRGFAVVAEEVRKLAVQSANAAREIGQLINQIQSGVDVAVRSMEQGAVDVGEGVKLTSEAGVALDNITRAIYDSIALVKDIAAGSEQTSDGTQQLSAANEQVTSTIQQISSASQELARIASELQIAVEKFKV